ncbi:hypothetical protein GGH99_003646 [Coemansia sp. RSA 1285]|nr:hypothetical protein EV177_008244 [Coemansia sp. RSA 1804]KAJ2685838.1 hypothetical protein GGH99_003646 [Coemansia sp. RSA 1285]
MSSRSDAVLRRRRQPTPSHHGSSLQSAKDSNGRTSEGIPYLQAQVVHYKPRVSVLDKELTTVSYHGLVNFLLLLLSATLLRMAIENYMKYGILVSIPGSSVSFQDWMATLAGVTMVALCFFVAYAIERRAIPSKNDGGELSLKPAHSRVTAQAVGITAQDRLTISMHVANLLFVLIAPSCLTYFAIFQPALGTVVMALACIMFLKLYSLAATNFDLRRAYRLGDTRLDNDPLRFSRIRRWQFDVNTVNSSSNSVKPSAAYSEEKNKASDADHATPDAIVGSSSDSGESNQISNNNSNRNTMRSKCKRNGIGAEVYSVEEFVNTMVPRTLRTSFSMNARMLDDLHVGGNDRIDAKADALPRPRTRFRAASTAPNLLRRAATISDSGYSPEPTLLDDGAQSDDGASAEAMVARKALDSTLPGHSEATFSNYSPVSQPMQSTQTVPRQGSGGASKRPVNRQQIQYSVAYPQNVTLKNFGYFWLAPTLCYQPSYPRVPGPISKSFLAKRIAEFVILAIAMYVVIQQYAVPTLVGSVRAIDAGNAFRLSERVLKLSVISATVWFLGFYAIFHAGLNALAEVLRFADRAFYLDWWNSVDLAAYWREWNLPIHYFCKRHIMVPLIAAPLSLPVGVGAVVTFFISAIMHELLFGIPTHCLKGYSFVGMMMQIPLIQLTQLLVKWRGPESGLGNAVFWISFCIVGQPLGVVQYYYFWAKNNPQ